MYATSCASGLRRLVLHQPPCACWLGTRAHLHAPLSALYLLHLLGWRVQAVATACVFVASKLDSVYHRLENIVHTSICELRRAQQRSMEPEYFNADGVGLLGVLCYAAVVAWCG